MELRMIVKAGVVVSAVMLPLGASAEPAGGLGPVSRNAKSAGAKSSDGRLSDGPSGIGSKEPSKESPGAAPKGSPQGSSRPGLLSDIDLPGEREEAGGPGGGSGSAFTGSAGSALWTVARCGPEPTSPEGVEGWTCVMADGHATWARSYYRNTTGDELRSVPTLMGPGGRTVETHCTVGSQDEPGDCETRHRPSYGGPEEYVAVAGYADGGGAADEAPPLLRSGSDPAPSAVG